VVSSSEVYLPFDHRTKVFLFPLNTAKLIGDYFNNRQMRGELFDVLHLFKFLMLAVTRKPEKSRSNQKAWTNRKLV
jgi:hypothetical protein